MISKILACLFLRAVLAGAADVKLPFLKTDSETYSNVTVTSTTATDIYFIHSRGLGNAKLKSLDPELQKMFHYDPTKAAAKAAQQAEANARYTQAAKEAAAAQRPPAEPEPKEETPAADDIPPHEINADSFINQPAPKIVVQKWLTEEPNLAGKFVIVDFWATWCGPCRKTIPALNDLAAKYKDRLLVMGISDEPEQIVRKMTDPKIEYYVGIDINHESLTTINIRGIPHALLIDPKGIVRFEGHPTLLDGPKLEKLFAKYSE
jgi:cytochrome c biogenesis protein CcmG/thiol:disulfide interchange protein DsbE